MKSILIVVSIVAPLITACNFTFEIGIQSDSTQTPQDDTTIIAPNDNKEPKSWPDDCSVKVQNDRTAMVYVGDDVVMDIYVSSGGLAGLNCDNVLEMHAEKFGQQQADQKLLEIMERYP